MSFAPMLLALGIDVAVGWPRALYQRIGHPVTWMGAGIHQLDRRLNDQAGTPEERHRAGMMAALAVILGAMVIATAISLILPGGLAGLVLTGLLAAPFIAARSLHDHVKEVSDAIQFGDISAARQAVSMIVGRDPNGLDKAGIARGALESLAENSSDGVVAPIFWGVLLGLPGIVGYKAINTLDSMIGYRNERYRDFGRFAAKLDDVVNWIPARLTGLLFAVAGGRPGYVIFVMRRDAPQHRSPNAGWPEAAMAATLGCRLSGPRTYGDRVENQPWINETAPDPGAIEMQIGLTLYRRMLVLLAALLTVLALLGWG